MDPALIVSAGRSVVVGTPDLYIAIGGPNLDLVSTAANAGCPVDKFARRALRVIPIVAGLYFDIKVAVNGVITLGVIGHAQFNIQVHGKIFGQGENDIAITRDQADITLVFRVLLDGSG